MFLHTINNELGFQIGPTAKSGVIDRFGNKCHLCAGRVLYQSFYAFAVRENTVMVAQETQLASIDDVCIAQNDATILQNLSFQTSLSFF